MEEKKNKGNGITILLIIIMILLLGSTVYLYVQNQKLSKEICSTIYSEEQKLIDDSVASPELLSDEEEAIENIETKTRNVKIIEQTDIQKIEDALTKYLKDTGANVFTTKDGYKVEEVTIHAIEIYSERMCEATDKTNEYNMIKEDLDKGRIVADAIYTVKFKEPLPTENISLAGGGVGKIDGEYFTEERYVTYDPKTEEIYLHTGL